MGVAKLPASSGKPPRKPCCHHQNNKKQEDSQPAEANIFLPRRRRLEAGNELRLARPFAVFGGYGAGAAGGLAEALQPFILVKVEKSQVIPDDAAIENATGHAVEAVRLQRLQMADADFGF